MSKKIRVCAGPHCSYRGSNRIMETLEKFFGIKAGRQTTETDLDFCRCTDFCEQGPNVVVNDNSIYHESKPKNIIERLEKELGEKIVKPDSGSLDKIVDNLI